MPNVGLLTSCGYPCSATTSGRSRMFSSFGSVFVSPFDVAGFGLFWGWFGLALLFTWSCFGLASGSVCVMYTKCSCSVYVGEPSSGPSCAGPPFSYRACRFGCGCAPGSLNNHFTTLGSSLLYPQSSRHHTVSVVDASESAPQVGHLTIFYA